tara:strand:+ start:1983 stop:3395 length:1413 start_codon:yes stop_codon:yes gene_type:complete
MQHFYDGQIRRYITQIVRLMSNFQYQDNKGNFTSIPVSYGDLTRQVASIIRDNSENKIPSAPRIAVYVTTLEIDRSRTSDQSYVSKLNVRERSYDPVTNSYGEESGNAYTVERIMPVPYILGVNVDIWATNTDQKLQILEQILCLFNPSLEIQTTDNYVDWTSLSVVNLENVNWSSRSIPVGVDSEIDISTIAFTTPIFISPPAKVKRLGVITNIITSVFNEAAGVIDFGEARPTLDAWQNAPLGATSNDSNRATRGDVDALANVNYNNYNIVVLNDTALIVEGSTVGEISWKPMFEQFSGPYQAGISRIFLNRTDMAGEVVATFTLDLSNSNRLLLDLDQDTIPTDTIIASNLQNKSKIDYIIDPANYNPSTIKNIGIRLLLLGDIGPHTGTTGPVAWQNNDNSYLVAEENDIIEWDGAKWTVVFDASATSTITYTTNLNTSVQYKYNGVSWVKSFEGEYQVGTWRIAL